MIDLNASEIALLIVLGIIIFGPDKIPELARKVARVVRFLRTIADTTTQHVREQLGPGYENLELRDLHPTAFVARHLPEYADLRKEINMGAASLSAEVRSVSEVAAASPRPPESTAPEPTPAQATPTSGEPLSIPADASTSTPTNPDAAARSRRVVFDPEAT